MKLPEEAYAEDKYRYHNGYRTLQADGVPPDRAFGLMECAVDKKAEHYQHEQNREGCYQRQEPGQCALQKNQETLPRIRTGQRPVPTLDIQILHIQRIILDELPPRLDVFAHERGEDSLALGNVFELDGKQRAALGVHGRFPELFRGHFA